MLLREKVVAESGRRLAIGIDDSKLSAKLGAQKLAPVEVVQFEWHRLADFLQSLGADLTLRLRAGGEASVTDQGKFVWIVHVGPIVDRAALAAEIRARAGTVEHRRFISLASGLSSPARMVDAPEPSRWVTNPVGVDQLPPSHIEAMNRPVHEAAEFRPSWPGQNEARQLARRSASTEQPWHPRSRGTPQGSFDLVNAERTGCSPRINARWIGRCSSAVWASACGVRNSCIGCARAPARVVPTC